MEQTELEYKSLGELEGETLTSTELEENYAVLVFGEYYTILEASSDYESDWSEIGEAGYRARSNLSGGMQVQLGLTTQEAIDAQRAAVVEERRVSTERYERQTYERLRVKFDNTYIQPTPDEAVGRQG